MALMEDTLEIKAKGCGIKAPVGGEVNMLSAKIAVGSPLILDLKIVADPHDPFSSLELYGDWSGGTVQESGPLLLDDMAYVGQLKLPTSGLPVGDHSLRVHVSHAEFNTTLFESIIPFQVIPPTLDMSLDPVEGASGDTVPLKLRGGGFISRKLRGNLSVVAVPGGYSILAGRKISLVRERELEISVDIANDIPAGTYDLELVFGSREASFRGTFTGALRIYQEGVRVELDPEQRTVASIKDTRLFLKVTNQGRMPFNGKVYLDLAGAITLENAFVSGAVISFEPGIEVDVELASSAELPPGSYRPVVKITSPDPIIINMDDEIRIRTDHDPRITGASSDSDIATPDSLVFIRVQHEDTGALPGCDVDISVRLKAPDDEVVMNTTRTVRCQGTRVEEEFEWDASTMKGYYSLLATMTLDGKMVSRISLPRFLQVSGGIEVNATAFGPGSVARSDRDARYSRKLEELLLEGERVHSVNVLRFKDDGKGHELRSHSLTSSSKIITIDGKLLGMDRDQGGMFFHGWQARSRSFYYPRTREVAGVLSMAVLLHLSTVMKELPSKVLSLLKNRKVRLDEFNRVVRSVLGDVEDSVSGMMADVDEDAFSTTLPMLDAMADAGTKECKKVLGIGSCGGGEKQLIRKLNAYIGTLRSFDTDRADEVLEPFKKGLQAYLESEPSPVLVPYSGKKARVLCTKIEASLSYISMIHALTTLEALELIENDNICTPEQMHRMSASFCRMIITDIERYRFKAVVDPDSTRGEFMRAASHTGDSLIHHLKGLLGMMQISRELHSLTASGMHERIERAEQVRSIKVYDGKAGFTGAPSGRSRAMLGFNNSLDMPVSVDLFFAFPSRGWSLAEPGSVLDGDVYKVEGLKLPPGYMGLDIGVNLPRDLKPGSYQYGIRIALGGRTQNFELTPVLEFEQAQRSHPRMVILEGPIAPLEGFEGLHKTEVELLDRIKNVNLSSLSRTEREMVHGDLFLVEEYTRARRIKGDREKALFDLIERSPLFSSEKVNVRRGLLITRDVERIGIRSHGWERLGREDIHPHLAAALGSRWLREGLLATIDRYMVTGTVDTTAFRSVLDTKEAYRSSAPSARSILSRLKASKIKVDQGEESFRQKQADRVKRYDRKLDRDRWFSFSNGTIATSVTSWIQGIYHVDAEVISEHLKGGDFEEWLYERTPYRELGDIIAVISHRLAEELEEGVVDPVGAKREFISAIERTELSLLIHRFILEPMLKKLDSPNEQAVLDVIDGLVRINDPRTVDALVGKLYHPSKKVRSALIKALVEMNDQRALPHLEKLAHFSSDPRDRAIAEQAVETLRH